jgi:MFS family permease
MLSTTLLFAIDNTIVANIQPSIINEFGHLELMSWIGTGFALGTMFILLWGKVYGVFNIKWVYIFNIFLFEAGSAVCGAAPNVQALIIGRVIAGVGGSGMYSGTLTYVSVLTNQQEKPAHLAGSTVVWGIGSVLGPVVSSTPSSSLALCILISFNRLVAHSQQAARPGDGYAYFAPCFARHLLTQ